MCIPVLDTDSLIDAASSIVQALCAAVMVYFTWRLTRVSEQQREIMSLQGETTFELERGRLYCEQATALSGKMRLRFANTGRSHLELEQIEMVRVSGDYPNYNDVDWSNPTEIHFTRMIEPGARYEDSEGYAMHSFNRPGSNRALSPFYMACRATYSTLGRRREYRWGWVFVLDEEAPEKGLTSGDRWVGRGYERDVPL